MTDQTFLVGTGVESIYACRLTSAGQLELLHEKKCAKGSSWLVVRDDLLHATNRSDDRIDTFTIDDRNQGKLTWKSTVSCMGHMPCSLDIDPSGKWLAVTNYGEQGISNFAFLPLNHSGLPEEKGAQINSIEGSGPHPNRQDHSHCHHVLFYKDHLYLVDLGTDTVSVYRFDSANGQAKLVGDRIKTAPGAGPRHIIFHPNKPLAFVCNELNSTVDVYRVDTSLGQLKHLQTINTRRQQDENDATKENATAELQFTPDGKCLLVSNRGDENLVIYNVNDGDGGGDKEVLSVKEHLDCRGSFTRYFTFDPTGKFLLVANQKSNGLVCFSYDDKSGTYTLVSELDNIESPQHMVFLS